MYIFLATYRRTRGTRQQEERVRRIVLRCLVWLCCGTAGPAWAVNVTFTVDMSQQSVSPNGVYLAGDFQGWDPAATPMVNMGNGIWSITLDLPPGIYEYKFINGNTWGPDELVPSFCGTDNGLGSYNREVTVGTEDMASDAVCFGQCGACTTGLYTLNGSAVALGSDCYGITTAQQWENGTVWYGNQLDLAQPFDLQFLVNLGANDPDGADGIVFALQRVGPNAIGASGGGMGFQSFGTSFGVEFDTYENLEFADPVEDHLSMQVNGDVLHYSPANIAGPVQLSSLTPNVEDGADHVVQITWDPSVPLIEVFFDCELRLSAVYDIPAEIFNGQTMVYWGFTGATGALFNGQTLCLQNTAIQVNAYTICPGGSVLLSAGSSSTNTYSWAPVDYLDDPQSATPTATPPVTTTYEVTVTDLCNQVLTRYVTVHVLENDPACSILPLRVVDLSVHTSPDGMTDELCWSVIADEAIASFTAERANQSWHFAPIAAAPGTVQPFTWTDRCVAIPAVDGTRYYRIAWTDAQGEVHHHPQVVVAEDRTAPTWSILASGNALRIQGPLAPVGVSIYTPAGSLVERRTVAAAPVDHLFYPGPGLWCVLLTNARGEVVYSARCFLP